MVAAAGHEPAWSVPWGRSALLTAVVCLGLSTQFLFQRELYTLWQSDIIVRAWLNQWCELMLTGGAILVAVASAGRLSLRRFPAKAIGFTSAVLVGALVGETLSQWLAWDSLRGTDLGAIAERSWRWLPLALLAGWLLHLRAGVTAATAASRAAAMAQLELARRGTETELEILQARIEPHFLFNTLATIRRLQHSDPRRGQETLGSFIHYLRATLPQMREREITLGCELALVSSYLQLLKARMEERLQVAIDVPVDLHALCLPPLSLATLVENAIKHGLGTLAQGGTVSIAARRDGGNLVIHVSDTGVGLVGSGGAGSGLMNLRGRLRALYGTQGSIALMANHPRGAIATLCLPAHFATQGDRS